MRLVLQYDKTVKEIKKEFNHFYPYLKLELYAQTFSSNWGTLSREKLPDYITLGEVNGVLQEGFIKLSPEKSIEELEQTFLNQYHIPVRVFYRLSADEWVEAKATRNLTLGKLSSMAREIAPIQRNQHTRPNILL